MSETINPVDILTLERPIVAIVRFAKPDFLPEAEYEAPRAGKFFQVTIDPKSLSGSKEFIRFGEVHGDEIMGWQEVASIVVEEVLATFTEGQDPPRIGNMVLVRTLPATEVEKVAETTH